tara:strand:+ start:492 stop:719 length:228 start_codon:yes stop_codon:yes gene_type:complete
MTTYYITSDDGGTMELGTDNGFGVFWTDQGMRVLMNIVNNHPERLSKTKILTQQGNEMTVGEFLEKIEKLKVRVQ